MMLRLLCWAVFLVFLCAITPAVAAPEQPPRELIAQVIAHPEVHTGTCKVDSMKLSAVNCRIFYNEPEKVVWLCLFDKRNAITHIIRVHEGKEEYVWTRSNLKT